MQINTFLNRLAGYPIGFSVFGIFVIDKNTILTVSYTLNRPSHLYPFSSFL